MARVRHAAEVRHADEAQGFPLPALFENAFFENAFFGNAFNRPLSATRPAARPKLRYQARRQLEEDEEQGLLADAPSQEQALELMADLVDRRRAWQNLGKMLLVFGCIGSEFCKKICILQHFSKSTRFSS